MRFDEGADLDASDVTDQRGLGGPLAIGGGGLGIVGLIIYLVMSQLGGGGGTLPALGFGDVRPDQNVSSEQIQQKCKTGADANRQPDCRAVALINSVQAYWTGQMSHTGTQYQRAKTVFFTGGVQTRCGGASSASGPFYCPANAQVYIDLGFFRELQTKFGAAGGPFVEGYVLAHEYGHHVQNLLGVERRVRTRQGPTSDSVRLELQADCYAGAWANHATTTPTKSGRPLIVGVTDQDVANALDAAGRIGDDYIQRELGRGRVDTATFTHGSAAQRQKWYSTGYKTGDPAQCDTFAAGDLG